jgi:uncharacterized damage-inducible protein DinB
MDKTILEDFETGGLELQKAIAGLKREQLLWAPPPAAGIGLWTIQQVVCHLMDDELIWTSRMKQIIAEDHPKIMGYDESKFAAKLHYEAMDAQVAAQMLVLNRQQFSAILKALPESTFGRTGEHVDIGVFTVEQGVTWTAEHLHHHVRYIEMKKERQANG